MKYRSAPSILSTLLLCLHLTAQTPTLIKDIHNGPAFNPSSNPTQITVAQDRVFFVASTPATGIELFVVNGPKGSPTLVKDLVPGPGGADILELTAAGKKVFFRYFTPQTGFELWVSDGTSAGTFMVVDLIPGTQGSIPTGLTAFGNKIMFVGFGKVGPTHIGREPHISDGTAAGTRLLRDIHIGSSDSNPGNMVPWLGKIFFDAHDGNNRQLFETDGTPAGTKYTPWSSASNFTPASPTRAFFAQWITNASWLMVTDGTVSGTRQLIRLQYVCRPSWTGFTGAGGRLFFSLEDCVHGPELWVSDGKTTKLVRDIYPGPIGSRPRSLIAMGSAVFLRPDDGLANGALWKSDGTAKGTSMLNPIPGGTETVAGKQLFFTATTTTTGRELWRSDCTRSGTRLVKDIAPGTLGISPDALVPYGNKVLFAADDGIHGKEIWESDGTAAGTRLRWDVSPPPPGITGSSTPRSVHDSDGTLLFSADDGVHGRELWSTDNTDPGTVMLRDIRVGSGSSDPTGFVEFANRTWFAATDQASGRELWSTDKTTLGTKRMTELAPGPASSNPHSLTIVGDQMFFVATGPFGEELYVTNGSRAQLVRDTRPGAYGSNPSNLLALRGRLFFVADDGTAGRELHVSDGTVAGTKLLKDVHVGKAASSPSELLVVGGALYFAASDATAGRELWTSNGTTAGTKMVADIRSGTPGSFPEHLISAGATLYFVADDGKVGQELWKSSGTSASLVKDIHSSTGSSIQGLHALESTIVFAADDGSTGMELWTSDGSSAGTVRLRDIRQGSPGSYPSDFARIGSRRLFFAADDGVSGTELWSTDGTPSGTIRVADTHAGPRSSAPGSVSQSFGSLVYRADDGTKGAELWKLAIGATSQAIGRGCSNTTQPTLHATDPVLGLTTRISMTSSHVSKSFFLVVAVPIRTPIQLGGGPCSLYVHPIFNIPMGFKTNASGGFVSSLAVPSTPSLNGSIVAIQAAIGNSGPPPLGTDLTNGVWMTLGR